MFVLIMFSCDTLQKVADSSGINVNNPINTAPSISNDEVINGLKEALTIGATKGAEQASNVGGFLKNDIIIPPRIESK